MKRVLFGIVVIVFLCSLIQCDDTNDSYLMALKKSKDIETLADTRTSRGDFQPSYFLDNSVAPQYSQQTTSSDYDATGYHYQQPKPSYGPPQYEPPKPIYTAAVVPPTIHQVYYGHSAPQHNYPVAWEGPREDHWLLNKLKIKMDFFTIGKILLKLIIFKKIVKFIALICLLLFLPKLQAATTPDKDEDEVLEERRQFDAKYNLSSRINEVTAFALTAMDAFSKKYPDSCSSPIDITCRLGKMVDAVDQKYPYQKVIKLYLPESESQMADEVTD